MKPFEENEIKQNIEIFLHKENPNITDKEKAEFLINIIQSTIFDKDPSFKEIRSGLQSSVQFNQYPSFLNYLYNAFTDCIWFEKRKKQLEEKHQLGD